MKHGWVISCEPILHMSLRVYSSLVKTEQMSRHSVYLVWTKNHFGKKIEVLRLSIQRGIHQLVLLMLS